MNIENIIVEMARIIEARNNYESKAQFFEHKTEELKFLLKKRDEKVDDLYLDLNNLKDENIQLKEQIIKLENQLDYANGDYIVEEEN